MPIRLDKLVSERFGLSRRAAQEAVLTGRVDLDGLRCDEPGRLIEPDATLRFDPNRPKARRVVGKEAIRVLHDDAHILIVDKPPGLPTVPSYEGEEDTLLARVERYVAIRRGGRPFVGVVHRLDRETSGALAVALSPEARAGLQSLFRSHSIERQYLAVVEGHVERPQGTIDVNLITDDGELRRRVARSPGEGRRAVTHYRVVEHFGRVATLLACWLETGRTHQIRLHLAEIGHPVVGDPVYRPRHQPKTKARFARQALHAQTLGFVHPLTGRAVRGEAPLPADLLALIEDLRLRYGIAGAGG
jgi:23S rRNA pseudouridine1911/1915/1917 synthase